ncbi:hypothetical protein [Algoriphagus antarcticus]|uniref:Uncharacterized protein n=1 Tax=Algoriphagus antarcticus TaxID=238540 RepID=A0A3E0DC74_9BACT|nr:hypothetical protein [Algoriphagus antarcticus]REG79572.1 hypothetical protein C8N25_1309 [Algoriphagus antarcticus]
MKSTYINLIMLTINNSLTDLELFSSLGKKKDDVDKGTTRKTPGNSEGARPPKKEDYKKAERENDRENDPQEETVDNEERDKNKD